MAEQQRPSSPSPQSSEQPEKKQRKLSADEQKVQDNKESFTSEQDAYEQGWWGNRDTPFDDSEFALTTGPNSPGEADLVNPDEYDSSKSVLEK
jgi:hypothetical protein